MQATRTRRAVAANGPIRRQWRAWRYRRLPGWLAAKVAQDQVEAEAVAVCIGALNRSGPRIENLLASLRGQYLPETCVDITICDLGSQPEHLDDLKRRCERHRARLICLHEPEPVWSRSRAVNIAVKHSNRFARYILPTDLDMLFSPNFIEAVLRTHLALKDRCFVISDALDLPPEAMAKVFDPVHEFDRLRDAATYRDCVGSGACQSTTRAWWHLVHGYDERLRGWGYEDDDLLTRARRSRLLPITIQDRADMLHQWHETEASMAQRQGRVDEFRQGYERNQRLCRENHSLVRNPDGWGELSPQAEIIEPE